MINPARVSIINDRDMKRKAGPILLHFVTTCYIYFTTRVGLGIERGIGCRLSFLTGNVERLTAEFTFTPSRRTRMFNARLILLAAACGLCCTLLVFCQAVNRRI